MFGGVRKECPKCKDEVSYVGSGSNLYCSKCGWIRSSWFAPKGRAPLERGIKPIPPPDITDICPECDGRLGSNEECGHCLQFELDLSIEDVAFLNETDKALRQNPVPLMPRSDLPPTPEVIEISADKETIRLSRGESESSDEVKIVLGLPPTVVRGQTHATRGEKKFIINLPAPDWSPTGHSGEWKWEQNDKGEMCWRWFDDIYGCEMPAKRSWSATPMPDRKTSNWGYKWKQLSGWKRIPIYVIAWVAFWLAVVSLYELHFISIEFLNK